MDKIYSRNRIRIPNFKFNNGIFNFKNNKNSKKNEKVLKLIFIIIIAISTAELIIKSITPILNKHCINMAKNIATKVSNEQTTEIMSKYKYDDICNMVKDTNGNIVMINSNTVIVNEIVSGITVNIQNKLNDIDNSKFNIKVKPGVSGPVTITTTYNGHKTNKYDYKQASNSTNANVQKVIYNIKLDTLQSSYNYKTPVNITGKITSNYRP